MNIIAEGGRQVSSSEDQQVREAIDTIRAGGLVIVADDEDRENEGDLVCAAERVTPEIINFMATHGGDRTQMGQPLPCLSTPHRNWA